MVSVTVWLREQGMIFCQAKSAGKKNGIQSVQALIKTLELAGATVTLNAMHCQKKTAKFIRKHWVSSIERMTLGSAVVRVRRTSPSFADCV